VFFAEEEPKLENIDDALTDDEDDEADDEAFLEEDSETKF